MSRVFQKLVKGLHYATQFRIDLHYAYHRGLGHDIDCCFALIHAIQYFIDQVLVYLGQPSVNTSRLLVYTTHIVPLPLSGIHHMDFVQDDIIHMLSWDDGLPELIVLDDGYEIIGVRLYFLVLTLFNLILDRAPL